jgi:hypothetical protein
MDEKRFEFLTTMIGILNRLQQTSLKHGEPLLAGMLGIALTEAEDSLRHAGDLEHLAKRREERSSTYTWRACDRPPDEERPRARIAA